ncbi:DUF4153 domain-containing protein [Roseisolibacter agri]|uniref:DUF4173 domain-containing protein n=1 Tax=Roseisolibacter agri TaxID=2014610 RepID=A0AA37PZ87_9BACT|nr:DUF4173 domain-containing protein [Roseisolibacter agri]GLC23675.1 hypothetical protein rosag_01880 [Roseisolibacter agri]
MPALSSLLPALPQPAVARRAVGAALTLGVLTDALLRAQPLGINLLLLTTALVAALAWLARRREQPLTLGAALLGALALVFAGAAGWRDAEALAALNVLALLTVLAALAAAVLHGDALDVDHAGPLAYVGGAVIMGARVAFGAPLLASRAVEAPPLPAPATLAGIGTLARGGLLAAPALLVFGVLLVSADRAFARMMEHLVAWDGGLVAQHVVVITVSAWMVGGYLYAALLAPRPAPIADAPATTLEHAIAPMSDLRAGLQGVGVGVREVTVAIALVDALFLTFGALQVGWLFGGSRALATAGVTVAEYARRGFFELVVVAALALPMLLLAHGLVGEGTPSPHSRRAHRHFRIAAGALIALVLVLLVSAADRMRLYLTAFGLTEQRFYASAFMAWLGVVFAWAGATLLRGRVAQFALGTLVSGWAWVLLLHAVNPDARIVNVNAVRAARGLDLDAEYLAGLSADAAPALVAHADTMLAATQREPRARCQLQWAFHHAARRAERRGDWRGWSLSRARARHLLPAAWLTAPAPCTPAPVPPPAS